MSVSDTPDSANPQFASLTREIVGQTIKEALGDFKHYFDSSLDSLQRKNERKLATSTQEVQQLKRAADMSLRLKGYKTQYNFNSSVLEKLEKVSQCLGGAKEEVAETLVKEAIADLKKRNKLIRLADKLDAVWKVVDEYVRDELASDSEDEKRMRKAQARASTKKRQEKTQLILRSDYLSELPLELPLLDRDIVAEENIGASQKMGYEFKLTSNYFKYEQGLAQPLVKGRLKSAFAFWESITDNSVVLVVVQQG
ncbi:uncharacterized protein LOC117303495 [Asterias rubens]|uniref:uncharacterized protein LOC117303495 n=1 Tax=Asterias rubens TaxID=7604 RepID=UPI0014551902|nr:uncharacterized protein LOC117303495 [Asterias rubens]